jgi:alpha-beta hydrolase superfamily lysophospholipase
VVHTPGPDFTGKRPAVLILHGFGGHKDGPQQRWSSNQFAGWGYVALRLDYRGCGESEGRRGWVLPLEQVADTRNAMSYLAGRSDVDASRIALVGTSYGASVAIWAAAIDARAGAVIAQGGWANGERKVREQHPTPEAWAKFSNMLEKGRAHKAATGESPMVHRYDVVPVPEHLRANIDARSIFEFPVDTPLETIAFNPEEVIAKIAPRPILLMHAANDRVTPVNGAIELFRAAQQPCELVLMSDVDHFMFGEDNPRVIAMVKDWLGRYFPA